MSEGRDFESVLKSCTKVSGRTAKASALCLTISASDRSPLAAQQDAQAAKD